MSEVIVTPAIIAPRTKVVNKLIQLCLKTDEGMEYILAQFPLALGAIKDTTLMFRNFTKILITNRLLAEMLLFTLGEIPLKTGITVKLDSADTLDLEYIFDIAKFRKVTTIEIDSIRDLASKIVNILVIKYKAYEIRPLPHILLFIPSKKILTRVCWCNKIEDKVDIYMSKQVTLLVADNVEIEDEFVDVLTPEKLEEIQPSFTDRLVDQITITEKQLEIWNREISKIKRMESKKKALELLKGGESSSESSRESSKEEIEESEERVET